MWPTLITRCAFGADAFATAPTWSNVSADVLEFAITRGRNHELDKVEAGQYNAVLRNTSGDYWRKNAASPHYPNVKPGVRLNQRAIYPPVELLDTFTRADSALTLGAGETFHTWTAVAGTWGISSNQAYSVTAGVADITAIAGIGADGVVQCDLKWVTGGDISVLVRYQAGAFIQCGIDATGTLRLYKFAGGYAAIDGGGYWIPAVNGTTYTVRIEMNGSALAVYLNGTLRISATESDCSTQTGVAFRFGAGAGIRWDSFSFKALTAPAGSPVCYDLYTGYVESWQHGYLLSGGKAPVVAVRCSDALKALAAYELSKNPGYSQELSSVRVGNVLDDLGWPAADRSIDTGLSTVLASGVLADVNALTHLRTVESTEGGLLWVAPDGKVTFQNRNARLSSAYMASQGTYGDDPGELPYTDLELEDDDELIRNDMRFTRTGGSRQTVTDSDSIDANGPRVLTRTGLFQATDAEVLDQARYYLARYKDAELRVKSLTIVPEQQPADCWPDVLGFDLGTRITVRRNEASIDEDKLIEMIEHRVTGIPLMWSTRWSLNPAVGQEFWTLDYSALDSGTRLAY